MDVETSSNYALPMSSALFQPVAVDYDPVERDVYWTEVGVLSQVRVASLDGSGVRTVTDVGDGQWIWIWFWFWFGTCLFDCLMSS